MVLFLLFHAISVSGQLHNNQGFSSSIVSLPFSDTSRVMALYEQAIEYRRQDPQLALDYAENALAIARKLNWKKGIADCLKNLGNTYHLLCDYPRERECYELSLKIFEEINDSVGIAKCLNNIGIAYYYIEDYDRALEYYNRSLAIMERFGRKKSVANSLNNIGAVYNSRGMHSLALGYYERALAIMRELNDRTGTSICLTNIGNRHKNMGDNAGAMDNYQAALEISRQIRDSAGIASGLSSIAEVYFRIGQYRMAAYYAGKACKLAERCRLLDVQRDALLTLSDSYQKMAKHEKSLQYYRKHIIIRDSIVSEEKVRQLHLVSMQIRYARQRSADSLAFAEAMLREELVHMKSLQRKNGQRNLFIFSSTVVLLISGALYTRLRYVRHARERIKAEKEISENLLLHILPAEIALELKEKGRAEARDFEFVSVLFADIEDFTVNSERMTPHELVAEINECFGAFDLISSRFRIEKIKTIGDSYMAAGGIPVPFADSVRNTVLAALQMQAFMQERCRERTESGKIGFRMRIGIHTGSVVAGIVGLNKFHYDIWGDTVNTAARMETSGVAERVNVSISPFEILKNDRQFRFVARGPVEAKHKGLVEMCFVEMADDGKSSASA